MKIFSAFPTIWIYTTLFINNLCHASPIEGRLANNDKPSTSISISLDTYFTNKAFGEGGNFDGQNNYFQTPIPNKYSKQYINYSFDAVDAQQKALDNIQVTEKQSTSINLQDASNKSLSLGGLYMLASASHGPATTTIKVIYSDGSEDTSTVSLPDWQDEFADQIERYHPIRYSISITNRVGFLFNVPIYVNPRKQPVRLNIQALKKAEAALHVFALQAFTASKPSEAIITSVQSVLQEVATDKQKVHPVRIRLHNIGATWIKDVQVYNQDNDEEADNGAVRDIMSKAVPPGHSSILYTEVDDSSNGREINVSLQYTTVQSDYEEEEENSHLTTEEIKITDLDEKEHTYSADLASVRQHRSPLWLKRAKFGIFIHWGLYSVPAWAPVGKSYAEWYWWNYNQKESPTYDHHRQSYGERFEYDQFLSLWKPDSFNPDTWLSLVDKSGAQYFVFTAKHHDGIALFNTTVSDRSTVHLLEQSRDFVDELMQRSKTAFPHLKRGLYFSLPEWYHPTYSDQSLGWHGPPFNPYTGVQVNYTGSRKVEDFVNELQVPQLLELTHTHEPDILWCDIGGIHNSSVWQAQYFNQAMAKNKQVAVNDRCGEGSASDYTTVEYKSITDMPTRFWEATRGMDPYSFGYNRETKPEEYASSSELIQTLVDTVAYGGNFLLNIGPEASGKVPQVMADRLGDIGDWLHKVGPAIFNTVPYWITAQEDDGLRFTASEDGSTIYVFYFTSNRTDTESDVKQQRTGVRQRLLIKTPLPELNKETATVRLLNDQTAKADWFYSTKDGLTVEYTFPDITLQHPLVFELKYLQ